VKVPRPQAGHRRPHLKEKTPMTLAAPPAVVSDVDLFSDDALRDPYPLYRELRDAGPATYLARHGLWFLSRYDQVRAALGDCKTFSSDPGIGLNDGFNTAWSSALICLARLEAHAVFSALAKRVTRIELTGEPPRAVNNITRGFARVPVTIR
jgi:cytochrome P450